MPAIRGPRLATLRATIRLLYRSHPRAFVVSAVASLAEPLFFPAFILLLQRLLLQITAGGTVHVTPTVIQLGAGLLVLLLVQRAAFQPCDVRITGAHRAEPVADGGAHQYAGRCALAARCAGLPQQSHP